MHVSTTVKNLFQSKANEAKHSLIHLMLQIRNFISNSLLPFYVAPRYLKSVTFLPDVILYNYFKLASALTPKYSIFGADEYDGVFYLWVDPTYHIHYKVFYLYVNSNIVHYKRTTCQNDLTIRETLG